ncbi:MAG: hypothetical protein H6597_05495 [Flavobacteriales bacterium]|nr:hypothetical protein [Flavobacteriales bacterium]MCB9193969.1 hypothetical protein [Flavobacteriales bacterium]
MRYAALYILAIFGSLASAQSPFEFADQRTHETWYTDCARAGGTWVVCGGAGSESGIGVYRFALGFHPDGSIAWETPLVSGTYPMIPMEMVPTSGASVLVVGPHDGCDVLMPTSSLMRIDAQGNIIWVKDLWLNYAGHLDQAPDGRILISTYERAMITDQQGDSLTTLELDSLGLPTLMWMRWDGDSALFAVRSGGRVERRTLQGTLLATNGAAWPTLQDVTNWNGHRLALEGSGMLHVLDAALQDQNTLMLGAPFDHGAFARGDSTLWVMGNALAVELDTDLTVLHTVDMDPDNVFDGQTFLGFAVKGDTIAMVGSATTAQRPAGLIRTILADGSVASVDADMSIAIENIDSTWYQLTNGVVFPRATVTVRVTNEGSGPVDKVVVSHWLINGGPCSTVGTTAHLQGLNLAPGAWTSVTLSDIWLNYAPWQSVDTVQLLCVAALSPNDQYDRDPSDNLACDTAHIALAVPEVTSMPFLLVSDPDGCGPMLVFREPIHTTLEIRLLDLLGRTLRMGTIAPGTSRYVLDMSSMAAGMRIIDVTDGHMGHWAAKWVRH